MQFVLEIVTTSLTAEERRGLALAEEIYKMRQSPTESKALIMVLKEIIRECIKRNVRYGRALYLQFKRLERGEWTPQVTQTITPTISTPSEEALIAHAKTIYSPEQFDRWLEIHQQAKTVRAEPRKLIPIEKGRKAHG